MRLGDLPEDTGQVGGVQAKCQKHWLCNQTGEDSDSDSVTCYLPSDFRQVAYFIISGRLTDKLSIMISAWLGCEHRSSGFLRVPSPILDT